MHRDGKHIYTAINEKINKMKQHKDSMKEEKNPVISPGTLVYSPIEGKGQVIAIEVSLPNCQTNLRQEHKTLVVLLVWARQWIISWI